MATAQPVDVPALMQLAKRLALSAEQLVEGEFALHRPSRQVGAGVAVRDVRAWTEGDDLRAVDWNVTARMHALHVKQFVAERERPLHVMLDASASMLRSPDGGAPLQRGIEVAALLAFVALHRGDAVSLSVVTSEVEHYVPAQRGRRHVMRLLRDLLAFVPQRRDGDLAVGLRHFRTVTPRRAHCVTISDFHGSLHELEPEVRRVLAHHDWQPVVITPQAPELLPREGIWRLRDPETDAVTDIDSNRLADAYFRHRAQLLETCRAWQLAPLWLDPRARPGPELLTSWLALSRQRRKALTRRRGGV